MKAGFTESNEFLPSHKPTVGQSHPTKPNIQHRLLEHILTSTEPSHPQGILNAIDSFCAKEWMMCLGPLKGKIAIDALQRHKPKNILQIGGYCGYSALLMAANSNAHVTTLQVNPSFIDIATKIQAHAKMSERIRIHRGSVDTSKDYLQQNGPFDFVFIDHLKDLYLKDFHLLCSYGVISKGACIVADNIICPGAPQYLAYFKNSKDYASTLYHSYLEYSDYRDAVLVSYKLL